MAKSKIELRSHYETTADGVFFLEVRNDPASGALIPLPPLWLCDPIEILGCGTDESGRQHRILRWRRQGNGELILHALPNAEIGERAGWARLRSGGLVITTNRAAQQKLAYWLQKSEPLDWHCISSMPGWQQDAFVLPGGELIGTPQNKLIFTGTTKEAGAYQPSGTLEEWQGTVGLLVRGNPLPMTAIACALAGPLLDIIGMRDGIGLHLFARTSSGKSTCGDVAMSVWANPAEAQHSWDGTTLGLANAAESCNDTMLFLDEIGTGDARKIGTAIYSMLNGAAKLQGDRNGGNRATRTWRLTLLSTGEVALSQFMQEGGQTARGGQEIRLLNVPADAGQYRAFDCIHHFDDGDAFATALTNAARSYYGTLGRAFISWLIEHFEEVSAWVERHQEAWLRGVPTGAAPAVKRATRKFAVMSAAAEMASHAGLTGWTTDEAVEAVRITWQRWLAAFGTNDRDDSRLIEQAVGMLQAHQYSRFLTLPLREQGVEMGVRDLMGYKRREPSGDMIFLVLPTAFKNEVIRGYEPRHACEVLHQAGVLERPSVPNRWSTNAGKGIGQVYRMRLHDEENA